ncbi:Pr6Pr family membrane protein [Salinibius halmophilus]|uniref:Pr6Pr family membrane protein n=1 Tax=Salinibius halmophilus TaxID=1853216 RepID=UPI000E66003A|nr:Pr6Pr family membrane protein [Salinibius halmophilus]
MLIRSLRFWATIFAVLATANLAMKHWLIIAAVVAEGEPVGAELLRFYSFFTHWANILCCIFFIGLALPSGKLHKLARLPGVRSALTVYMTVVAIVYHALLADLWDPQGLTYVADLMFHTLVPAAVFAIWLLAGETARIAYKTVLWFIALPFIYLVYSLVRGAFSNYYPYFFLDVNDLGYQGVAISSLALLIAFLGLGFLFAALANLRYRARRDEA